MQKTNPHVPVIEVENLIVKYGERIVLNNITTRVAASEIKVILGTSGCGKTTLLKTLVGLLEPEQGTVKLFGKEIRDGDSSETAEILKHVGVLFQNGALLGSLTVGENVALPLQMHTSLPKGVMREIVLLKLTQVDLPGVYDLMPQELSGGMRKRAALARALVLDPPLMFCDEPSAGLDPVTSAGLDELLLRLRESLGITILVVSHELSSIRTIADNVVFLHNGEVLFDGSLTDGLATKSGPVFDFFNRREHHEKVFTHAAMNFTVENVL
ncbi:MAG: ATP-binding cassette domain-containing protein [Chitinivibrionales bacterium]